MCLSSFLSGFSQEKDTIAFKKNELKGNALFLVLGAGEITYERLLNEESGVGISFLAPYTEGVDLNFSISPFYRFYFGKKPAAGFFAEGFGMFDSYQSYIYNNGMQSNGKMSRTDFAIGFGLGGKWVTKRGFVFEINGGVGRNLFNSSDTDYEIIGRGGITLGYRF